MLGLKWQEVASEENNPSLIPLKLFSLQQTIPPIKFTNLAYVFVI